MIKLVALDIDGTLLNHDGKITDRTKQAIIRLRRAGVEITLCTGRNLPLARPYAEALRITLPISTCNGAEIRRLDGELLQRHSMSFELSRQVYDILQQCGTLFDIYSEDSIVIENKPVHLQRLIHYYRVIRNMDKEYEVLLKQELNMSHVFEAHDISNWLGSKSATIEKFYVMEERPERLETMYEQLSQLPGITVTTSHHTALEVTASSVDKGKALQQIVDIFGCAREDVVAIGDGMNDVSMFNFAGVSIAMGNASDEVKRCADFVAGPNTEEGLAEVLEQRII